MGCVQVRENVYIRLSRRSMCDNCSAELCVYNKGQRVTECDRFTPAIVAFKKCVCCGDIFEVSANFQAIDYDRCMKCNGHDELCVRA
ncbi:MAG: hypothetical protein ACOX80_02405 [Methanomassiliicoccaceae archaeon]|jgi:hypothetical protein|nr:hypothetical protein [Euryarchaeota archaeon]HOB37508.1 hypothetical protein [Methanomassiliicoccaceae archaeon]